ncbi:MAG: hypothetical protein KDC45_09475 [Bacteroidetes bacterium]|nr:hypothetical protein [Bacteroidota bacterium]
MQIFKELRLYLLAAGLSLLLLNPKEPRTSAVNPKVAKPASHNYETAWTEELRAIVEQEYEQNTLADSIVADVLDSLSVADVLDFEVPLLQIADKRVIR